MARRYPKDPERFGDRRKDSRQLESWPITYATYRVRAWIHVMVNFGSS